MAKLFIICGHGAGDSGAVGNGYTEAERVRALAQRIKDFGGANVVLGNFNRNYYKDNGISSLTISKEYKIIELHMDSGASTARGGHVIINGNFKADKYDTALADLMKTVLPGRSSVIVGRTDLANVKRAAKKGYNYRLLECGFISNAEDVKIFNSKMDDIAKGILNSFGIGSGSEVPPTQNNPTPPAPKPTLPTSGYNGNSIVDYLESIGQDSSFANRKKLAEKYGIKNYEGTSAQNLELLNKMKNNTSQSGNSSSYTGNSLVDYLKSIGKDSSFDARKKYAAQYGIKNYEGTSVQNTALLNAMRGNSKPSAPKPQPPVSYYKVVNKNGLVPSLKAIGVDSSFAHRKAIAKANGIANYTGTYEQNDKLATLLANGKLKKA